MPTDRSFKDWAWEFHGKDVPYGLFFADVFNFLIVAFALYLFIAKFLGWLIHTKKADPPPPTKDQELLMEIRDLLKARQSSTSGL
jgi:large conductance mechanosensitive channel